jgi:hypothetical protein
VFSGKPVSARYWVDRTLSSDQAVARSAVVQR